MVAPLVEALLLRTLRRRAASAPHPTVNRLVGEPHPVDHLAYVVEGTTVLRERPGSAVEVLPAGSLVLPSLGGGPGATYVVLSHAPVEVWLRIGPFETLEGRVVQQVELELTVSLGDSASGLAALADPAQGGARELGGLGQALLDRLAREVSTRTTEALRRRTLGELTGLSLGVLLDQALPATFLGGLVERSALAVTDVDWPTEGRGWPAPVGPYPGGTAGVPGPVPR